MWPCNTPHSEKKNLFGALHWCIVSTLGLPERVGDVFGSECTLVFTNNSHIVYFIHKTSRNSQEV